MSINKAFSEPWQGTGRKGAGEWGIVGSVWGVRGAPIRRKCRPSRQAGSFASPRLVCLRKKYQ